MNQFFKKILILSLAVTIVPLSLATVEAKTYTIDGSHSTIGFAVKHLQVGTTRGVFVDYTGEITFDEADLAAFGADVTINVASIDTNNEKRDNHLKAPDFFDAENHPSITFKNARIAKLADGYSILGELTIRGISKAISVPVTIAGPIASPSGGEALGLAGSTTINRQDFGVSWNKDLDSGGVMVSDAVELTIEIEAHAPDSE